MIHWGTAVVTDCMQTRAGVQEISVMMDSGEIARAIHYTDALPPVQAGDTVLVNTTAADLRLGTGGYHFVYAVLNRRPEQAADPWQHGAGSVARSEGSRDAILPSGGRAVQTGAGHMMKLRYTPLQRKVLAAEEQESPYHGLFRENRHLHGCPVLIGELHSMLPSAVCWLRHLSERRKEAAETAAPPTIGYIMSDGGALPLAFSRHAALLRDLGWIAGTVTYGHAYGGDLETINKFTALLAAKHILQADVIMVTMGPGIAGTGTRFGHSGVEVGELVNAVAVLGGIPVVIPRISFIDRRDRHRGLSHHTLTVLSSIALRQAVLPLPDNIPEAEKSVIRRQIEVSGCGLLHDIQWIHTGEAEDLQTGFARYPLPVTTMGTGLKENPGFFLGVCAAAQYVWERWCGSPRRRQDNRAGSTAPTADASPASSNDGGFPTLFRRDTTE